jgi:mRNA interferase MazF
LVWLDFDPQAGSEQAGRRPAVVLSASSYNATVGLAICCPITNQAKGYPFEVGLPAGCRVAGIVLADQVKCLDWRERKAEYICSVPAKTVDDVVDRISKIIFI